MRLFGLIVGWMFVCSAILATPTHAWQQDVLKQALSIKPIQTVEVDVPEESELASCEVKRAIEVIEISGYIVVDNAGRKLRQFLDTNNDKKLDTWQFYRNGTEVYRELDTNGDNKKDQFRWMGTAGTRWGIDNDQDGKIDTWKTISPEEVAAEVFLALRDQDLPRFRAVLLSENELKSLGLKSNLEGALRAKSDEAVKQFSKLKLAKVTPSSQYVHFGSATPFLLAADVEKGGNQSDVSFYDHASAVFSDGNSFGQLALGTLVQVGEGWRAAELPALMEEGKVVGNGGLLLQALPTGPAALDNQPGTEKIAELFEQLEALEAKLSNARPSPETEKAERQRADLLMQLVVANSGDENRRNWIRQLADTVTAAFEGGTFPSGLEALTEIGKQLKSKGVDKDLDYIQWRVIMTQFAKGSAGDRKERVEATEKFQGDLASFVKAYPSSTYAAEGMMQLALYAEVDAADEAELKEAVAKYEEIEKKFPDTNWGRRAKGAKTRLTCLSETLPFTGTTLTGEKFDLNDPKLRGKTVVLHFWATWCNVCVSDFQEFERLLAKYKGDLVVVGVNLDDDAEMVKDFLKKNPKFTWTQLFAPGGITESPLAEQLGVSTLPLNILLDKSGKVVDTGLSAKELDRTVQRLVDE